MMTQNLEKIKKTKRRVAWGITGSGDRLKKTVTVMKQICKEYENEVRITVYLSKAGSQVVRFYNLFSGLKNVFPKIREEVNSNIPSLALQLQSDKIDFLLIAPATSNTVAKISTGIADTLLTNAAIMALKAFIPVYVMPCDYQEGTTVTQLPDGTNMKIRIRKEDVAHTKKLAEMDGVTILETPKEIPQVFKKHFK